MYGARPEFTILQEPGVLVTSARFVVGQQTYPIANLTAVAPFTIPGSILGNVIGAIALAGLGGAFVIANMTSSGTSIGYLIGGPLHFQPLYSFRTVHARHASRC